MAGFTNVQTGMYARWDIALTSNETEMLARGTVPHLIQPEHLVEYRPVDMAGGEARMSSDKTSSKWTSGSNAPVVWGVDMASGESRSATMIISTASGDKTFPVKDVVWKRFVPPSPKAGDVEFKVTVADNLEWSLLSSPSTPNPFDRVFMSSRPRWGKSTVSEFLMERHKEKDMLFDSDIGEIRIHHKMMSPAELAKMYFDNKDKEENVNYLFRVYVIDVKNQTLLGEIPVVSSDVPRATAIATLRLDLNEDTLGHLKFHVEKICEVAAWDGD